MIVFCARYAAILPVQSQFTRPLMLFKSLVILLLVFAVSALFSGLFYLIRDKGQSTRTVKSLTWRIAISLVLFALLLIGAATGLIEPHPPV